MSHGPGCGGNALLKSVSESTQKRAAGIPGMLEAVSSAAVNGTRGGNCGCVDGGGAVLPAFPEADGFIRAWATHCG
jgi:hypothetical protein